MRVSHKQQGGLAWVTDAVADPAARVAVVASARHHARQIVAGLISVAATGQRPKFYVTRWMLRYPNGAEVRFYFDADEMRGTQHHAAWLAAISGRSRVAEQALLGLRLGRWPRALFTEDACS